MYNLFKHIAHPVRLEPTSAQNFNETFIKTESKLYLVVMTTSILTSFSISHLS